MFHAERPFPVELSQPPDPELIPTIEGTWLDEHIDAGELAAPRWPATTMHAPNPAAA